MSRFRIAAAACMLASSMSSMPAQAAPDCSAAFVPWTAKASCVLKWDPGSALLVEATATSTASGPPAWVRVRVVVFTGTPSNGTVTVDQVPLAACSDPPEEGARTAGCGAMRSPLTGPLGTKISVLCIVEGAIGGSYRCQ